MSRSSLDSTSSNVTMSSSSNSTNYATSTPSTAANSNLNATDMSDPGIGGVPNRYLGITSTYLWQTQLHQAPLSMVCG